MHVVLYLQGAVQFQAFDFFYLGLHVAYCSSCLDQQQTDNADFRADLAEHAIS